MIIERQFPQALWFAWFVLLLPVRGAGLDLLPARPENGLILRLTAGAGGGGETSVATNPELFVPFGQAPCALLQPGSFTAEFSGFISSDLRAEYRFEAKTSGQVSLVINDVPVPSLGFNSPYVRLGKGTNAFRLTFTPPTSGDAFVRLYWSNRETPRSPIPNTVLTYLPGPELTRSDGLRLGRSLFSELRCAQCHDTGSLPTDPGHRPAEFNLDAPDLGGIASRREPAWIAAWIQNPRALRSTARMPALFHGEAAGAEADAIAAFLGTLIEAEPAVIVPTSVAPEVAEVGRVLFGRLHCLACHLAPDEADSSVGTFRIPLGGVKAKFPSGQLARFLQKPQAHQSSIRMPDFHLSSEEAAQLAAFLESKARAPIPRKPPGATATIELGRRLIQERGCLNCHRAPISLQTRLRAPALVGLPAERLQRGCLAESPASQGAAPGYALTTDERVALRSLVGTGMGSLARQDPREYAGRLVHQLHCGECHGKVEGVPSIAFAGEKLRPEWMTSLFRGEVVEKPRPWLEARMPGFPLHATTLANGLAAARGYPSRTPVEGPVDAAAAKVGQTLVSAAGGFSCVACHAAGKVAAIQVFEGAGINFALVTDRLQKAYFHRWVRNPLAIDPATKMPVYFDEDGKSPLVEIHGGDGLRQREAIWNYLRLGRDLPPPPTP